MEKLLEALGALECMCEDEPIPMGVGVCAMPDEEAVPFLRQLLAKGYMSEDMLPDYVKAKLHGDAPVRKAVDMKDLCRNIKKVIYNDPVTVVLWEDGTRTIVRCQPNDTYSKETGLAMALLKRIGGNNSQFNEIFHKHCYEVR